LLAKTTDNPFANAFLAMVNPGSPVIRFAGELSINGYPHYDDSSYNLTGGTLAVNLANHALRRGYRALIVTYNLTVFDPSWFRADRPDLVGNPPQCLLSSYEKCPIRHRRTQPQPLREPGRMFQVASTPEEIT